MSAHCFFSGKVKYDSPGSALRARNGDKKGQKDIYRCRECRGYHLGRSREYRLMEAEARGKLTA